MKSTALKSLLLVTAVAMTSLVAIAQPVAKPVAAPLKETTYPEIPVIPPYIHMADSFQVYSITAP